MAAKIGLFDSDVLIAASIPSHADHANCLARLARLRGTSGACAAHTLAEVYNTADRT